VLRLLVIGALPEPKGGVSMHVQRLAAEMSSRGLSVRIFDQARFKAERWRHRIKRVGQAWRDIQWCDCIHIHTSSPPVRLAQVMLARIMHRPVLVTIHSAAAKGYSHYLSAAATALATEVIYVSDQVAGRFKRAGSVIPAFLPPAPSEFGMSAPVQKWIDSQRSAGRKIAATNAYSLALHNGEDLYGLDLLVEAFARESALADVACLFMLSDATTRADYLNSKIDEIAARGLAERFWVCTTSESFVSVISDVDVVVRATNTDGDPLTIREALYLGVPVAASDSAARPDGCVVFASRNAHDMARAISEALAAPAPSGWPGGAGVIHEIYGRLAVRR
jgi:glycosyltransferase involved in cell wall biosynthesis